MLSGLVGCGEDGSMNPKFETPIVCEGPQQGPRYRRKGAADQEISDDDPIDPNFNEQHRTQFDSGYVRLSSEREKTKKKKKASY